MIPIFADVHVVSKSTNKSTDGSKTYYNLKVADVTTYDSQIVGVPEEVYNAVSEGDDVQLSGQIGGLKEKYWFFNKVVVD